MFETGERSSTAAAYCRLVQNCSTDTENLIWGDGPAYWSNSAGPTAATLQVPLQPAGPLPS